MQKSRFLTLMTGALILGSATGPAVTEALSAWADKHLSVLTHRAEELLSGPFSYAEVGALAEEAVAAAQDLKGVIVGVGRARIAQAVLVMSIRAVLPDDTEHWVVPLLANDVAAAIIESAFLKLFGPVASQTAPVVDAPDLPEGGVQ